MGNCHSIDLGLVDISENLNTLLEENLLFLKGIYLRFVELGSYGTVIKLLKVYDITEKYYSKNESSRKKLLSKESRLCGKDYNLFEKSLDQELAQLKQTNETVKKEFKCVSNRWITPSVSQMSEYVLSLENKYLEVLQKLSSAFMENQTSNRHIESIAREANFGKEIAPSEEVIIRRICEATSYVANNRKLRVKYPAQSTKTKGAPSRAVTKKKEEIEILITVDTEEKSKTYRLTKYI